jgi:O-antigen ligase
MRTEQSSVFRSKPYAAPRPGVFARSTYEFAFGLLLLGLLLISTLDEAAAPIARGFVLASFAPLLLVNLGSALGVYIGAALLFATRFNGANSWVERPDNYALLFLTLYVVLGRGFGRNAGKLGSAALAIVLLLVSSLGHLVWVVGFDWVWIAWFARMFGIPLALFVLSRRAALTPREVYALLVILAVVGAYLAVVSVLEAFGWFNLLIPPWLADPGINPQFGLDRVGGLAMQPEWNALDLSLTFCVLLLLSRQDSRPGFRWLVLGGLYLLAIYFTGTRGAWLGLVLGGIPLFWQVSGARGIAVRRRALFVGVTLVLTIVVLFFPSDALQSRVSNTGNVFFRFNVWVAGLRMAADHPLLGVGYGQFGRNLSSYVQALGAIPEDPGLSFASTRTLAHNTFISVVAELGTLGLALYIWSIVGAYRAARDTAAASWGKDGRIWIAGFTLVYFTNIQFITAHELSSNLLYFCVLGSIAGMGDSRQKRLLRQPYARIAPDTEVIQPAQASS